MRFLISNHYCYKAYDKQSLISQSSKPRVIFSGIQPTGIPHVGNYFGAIEQWIDLQNKNDKLKRDDKMVISVVDLHALTIPQDPKVLREKIHQTISILLACGIDPKKTILFQQSTVKEHTELSWILACITNMSKLSHLPQWKEKSEKLKEHPIGLYTYPILQAADILLYNTTHVPVGEDQITHIELCRFLAKSFNKKFKNNVFRLPEMIIGEHKRLKSLRDPKKKMSKSDPDKKSTIGLIDSDDDIRNKLRKAMTDVLPSHQTNFISYDPISRPAIAALVDLHCACEDKIPEEIIEETTFMDSVTYKNLVAEALITKIAPIRENYERIVKDHRYVEEVIEQGRSQASDIASQTMERVRDAIGCR